MNKKELDDILQIALPDKYHEDSRKLLLSRLIKWHESKVKNLSLGSVGGSIPNTDDLDVTICPKCRSTDIAFYTGLANKCNECGNDFA